LVVGGAGSLYVDSEHKTRLIDTPDFPEMFKPLASSMGTALDALKVRSDVNWTYLSPSANFVADGIRTGEYISGGEELMVNSKGESVISYADYAVAMIDEAENANHLKKRFTVVSK
jgi:putative NADH-flavin reductase